MTERLSLGEAGPRKFEVVIPSERFRLLMPGLSLTLEADHLRWERGELIGQLTVALDLAGVASVDGIAESSTMNFSSLSTRSNRAGLLAKLTRTPDYPWSDILQTFCLQALKAVADGDPAVDLRDVAPEAASDTAETVLGIPVLRYDPMMIVAKGGEGKSLLLLKILGDLERRGFRVGYIDSEWNPFVHADRLSKLYGADSRPSIAYLRLNRSLPMEADRVRRFVYERGLDFIGLDSVGMGSDASLEYSDAPNQYLRAVRSLGRIGSILISHTKHDAADGSHKRPYGSPYWLNGCRSVWFLKSAPLSVTRYEVALEHIKYNTKKSDTVALSFEFGDHISITPIAADDLTELAGSVPIRDRIMSALKRRGSMTLDDLAEELNEKRDTVKRVINRDLRKSITKVESSDGKIVKFGLLERRTA
jgi:hypothetical protein